MFDGEKCFRCHHRFKFEELSLGPDGFSVCANCVSELNANNKRERLCPNDGQRMHGSFAGRFIVDRCDKCGGVWMSAEEIERLSYERNVGNVMHYHYMAAEFVDSLLKLAGKSPY